MPANRRTDTKPELALRRELHRQGLRYRKDYRLDLEGARVRPDLPYTARRVAVFVDGCFWHVCPQHGTKPANNTWYWGPKLTRNVERDRAADAALAAAGRGGGRGWGPRAAGGGGRGRGRGPAGGRLPRAGDPAGPAGHETDRLRPGRL